jgi:nitrite reductase (NADH) small subunit
MPETATIGAVKANLGSIEKIPLGQGRVFMIGGVDIAVFRQRDGRLFATQSRCPHRNGPLADGLVGGGKVVCPLHAKKFDLASGQCGEQDHCLTTYVVQEISGNIIVTLEGELKTKVLEAAGAAS